MNRGLYIASTAMLTNNKKMNVISNNMANINTAGFKKDRMVLESFNDVLIHKFNGSRLKSEAPAIVTSEVKGDNHHVKTDNGYFKIKTDNGYSYNKAGKFSLDERGYLSTYYLDSERNKDISLGDRVMGQNGEVFVGDQPYEINQKGEVIAGGQVIDTLVFQKPPSAIGTINAGIKNSRLVTDYNQASIQHTGKSLDFSIDGDGFFKVETEFGTAYTRNGQFKLSPDGTLLTSSGHYVQGFNGNIKLPNDQISVNEFGEIIANGEIIDKFQISEFENKNDLEKIGGTLFRYNENIAAGEIIDSTSKVMQFTIEESNVDSIKEMIKMMEMYRNYESGQRVVKSYDSTLDKIINDVGNPR